MLERNSVVAAALTVAHHVLLFEDPIRVAPKLLRLHLESFQRFSLSICFRLAVSGPVPGFAPIHWQQRGVNTVQEMANGIVVCR